MAEGRGRQQRRFETWGTYVHLETAERTDEAEALTREFLDRVDRACSRFRPDSDLSAVNRAAGAWVRCSPVLRTAIEVALEAARVTDGAVDPLLARPLVELGYDADLSRLTPRTTPPVTAARPGAWREVEIDADRGAVRIPAGTALDLGATCKAWAADMIAGTLVAALDTVALISLGGDLRVETPPGRERDWPVRITEHPDGRSESVPAAEILLGSGGLATSSVVVRRWRRDGVEVHHLLDPATGRPVSGPWRTITATGPTCLAANVATTAALVLAADGPDWLDRHHVDARLVGTAGQVRTTGRWPAGRTAVAS